jgi:hypothetical protein
MLAPFIAMLACMPYVLKMRAEYAGADKPIGKILAQEPQAAGTA